MFGISFIYLCWTEHLSTGVFFKLNLQVRMYLQEDLIFNICDVSTLWLSAWIFATTPDNFCEGYSYLCRWTIYGIYVSCVAWWDRKYPWPRAQRNRGCGDQKVTFPWILWLPRGKEGFNVVNALKLQMIIGHYERQFYCVSNITV